MKKKSPCVVLCRTKTCSLEKGNFILVCLLCGWLGEVYLRKVCNCDLYHRLTYDGHVVASL